MNEKPYDLSSVRFVKRIVLGSPDPAAPVAEDEIKARLEFLNRCLSGSPKGRIVGTEKNFTMVNIGEHQVVLQWIVYHVGFARKPGWMNDIG